MFEKQDTVTEKGSRAPADIQVMPVMSTTVRRIVVPGIADMQTGSGRTTMTDHGIGDAKNSRGVGIGATHPPNPPVSHVIEDTADIVELGGHHIK